LPLAGIQRRIPKHAQVIQYAVLEDKLLIWVISEGDFKLVAESLRRENLEALVSSYLSLLSADSQADQAIILEKSRQLFDILVKPVAPLLSRDKNLYIVADKILNYLPFASLASADKYLVEDYCLAYSPSSTVFVICSELAEKKQRGKPETLLGVGDPTFDRRRRELSNLPGLPGARREVETIAHYYDAPNVLTGERAGKQQIESATETADVIHFALHSIVDERSPLLSKLVLARAATGMGSLKEAAEFLKAYEVYQLKLRRARLVVLSACQTAVARYYQGEGMLNIARPFLAAGVPLTVASLWKVDSDSTAELMISFHKYRKLGNRSTTQALRLAQLDMLRRPEARLSHPNYWASFIVIGGHASF
jgi:CHAT domain-containing protein